MNTKDYIESGILEQYVIGSVSSQERQEVECMSKIYPEIELALNEIQVAMEGFASEYVVTPPDHLKAIILEEIAHEVQETDEILPSGENLKLKSSEVKTQYPSTEDFKTETNSTAEEKTPAIVKKLKRDPNNFPWRVAASVILLMACGLIYLLIDLDQDYEALSLEHQQTIQYYGQELKEAEELLQAKSDLLAFTTNKKTDKIIMSSTDVNASDEAIVYWNSDSHHVWLDYSSLPSLDNQHSYQLWALENGQPIDLGVVDGSQDQIIKMNAVAAADAFAITLEPFGGSEQPTLSALKVIGEI